jgi:cytochrome c
VGRRNLWLAGAIVGGLLIPTATALMPAGPACAQGPGELQRQRQQVSFAEDITPVLRGYCVSCHEPGGQGYQASGLDLTTYQGLMKGTKFGSMVVPGHPDESNLVVLIEGRGQLRMPYGHRPLPSCLRQEIWSWIFEGAKDN